jgi:formiminotetrahydrofolate cyclodeaminase
MLLDRSCRELIDAFASPAPTPGGGSASALAGAVGAALLAMVASLPKSRQNTPEDRAALDPAADELRRLAGELAGLIDRDAAAYDAVVAAYRLPRSTDAEKAARREAVAAATRGATEVPLQTMRTIRRALEPALIVARHGSANAASDVGVAVELLGAGLRGARLNVDINLGGLSDADYKAAVSAEAGRLADEAAAGSGRVERELAG